MYALFNAFEVRSELNRMGLEDMVVAVMQRLFMARNS